MSAEWWQFALILALIVPTFILSLMRLFKRHDEPLKISNLWPRRRLTAADFSDHRRVWAKSTLVVVFAMIAITLGVNLAVTSWAGELGDLLAGIGAVTSGGVALGLAWLQIRKDRRRHLIVQEEETRAESKSKSSPGEWSPGELFFLYQVLQELAIGNLDGDKVRSLNAVITRLQAGKGGDSNGKLQVSFNGAVSGGVALNDTLAVLREKLPKEQYEAIKAALEPTKELPPGESNSTGEA